jgi:proline iminopeptidase
MRILIAILLLSLPPFQACTQDLEGLLHINGTDLQVKTIGEGPAIIVLHGGPGLNYSYFLPQITDLARSHKVILFDQRACGKSSANLDSTQMTLEAMVDDIDHIRKHFGYDKVSVLGHSWGGLLAMKYAIKYPSHLQRLVLVSTVSPQAGEFAAETNKAIMSRMTKADSVARNAVMQSEAFKAGRGEAYENLFKLSFKATFHNPALIDSMNLHIDDDFAIKRTKLFLLAKDLGAVDLYPELHNIKAPVLIIHGDGDSTPKALPLKIQSSIPGSQLITIRDAGHFPFVEKRAEFGRAVLGFL